MLSFILTVLPLAIAQSIQIIEVGKGGNKFSPETLTAAVNSTVQFSFVGEGHSVSASAFTGPCKPVDDATFFSGDGEVGKSFTITINDTAPIWIYCPESNHCESGMVAVINAPTTGQTLDDFKSAAAKVSSSSEPPQVQGGEQSGETGNTTTTSTSASASASGAKATASASTPAKSNAYRTRVSTILGVVSFGLLFFI